MGFHSKNTKKKIPFLTNKQDEKIGKKRSERGSGYIPLESFMCPNSAHVDYLVELIKEVKGSKQLRIKGSAASHGDFQRSLYEVPIISMAKPQSRGENA